jgi:hypothetical protein
MEVLRRRRGNHLGLVPIRLDGDPGVEGSPPALGKCKRRARRRAP